MPVGLLEVLPIRPDSTDPAYLDAFLQGARFALFAMEGRLKDAGHEVSPPVQQAFDEFHDLYRSTRSGLEGHEPPVALIDRYVGKN